MGWLRALERRFGRFAIHNLTLTLIVGQCITYILCALSPGFEGAIVLLPKMVLGGELWRLFTFIFTPPNAHPIFIVFVFYLFYLMGTALESQWGAFNYNIFLLIGYLATVAVAFIFPHAIATNAFIATTVFLAFAWLYPNFEILLLFLLPVKVRWLAWVTWAFYFLMMVVGSWPIRLAIAASTVNFFVFFGSEVWFMLRTGQRRMAGQAQSIRQSSQPFHKCQVCGKTDKTAPEEVFRYCSKCKGEPCYCSEHIHNHPHIQ